MTQTSKKKMPVPQSGEPPYQFRTFWAIVLLVGNLIVAGIYFHVLDL